MTVNSNCFFLFLGLLLAAGTEESERATYLIESSDPPCTCPYSCVTTNECASRHADRGTEEVLFRCDGNRKICCPPVKKVSSRISINEPDRSQPSEYAHNIDCPGNRNVNRTNKNSESNVTNYKEQKQEQLEYFSTLEEFNVNVGNSGKQTNVFEQKRPGIQILGTTTRRTIAATQPSYTGNLNGNVDYNNQQFNKYPSNRPVGAPILSTTTRKTFVAEPTYTGELNENIDNRGQQPNVYPQRRPVGSQTISTTTRRTFTQETHSQFPTPNTPQQHRPLGLQNTKLPLSSHRNFHLLPRGSNCGVNNFANRISEGEEVSLGEYPWMALTGIRDKYGNFRWNCGGTLINAWYILTAAHCLAVDNRTVEYVRLGEHNLTNETDCSRDLCLEKPEDVPIAEVIPHENWNTTTIKNDIALIRLSRNSLISGKFNIYPICLPLEVDKLNITSTTKYEIAGWGKTDWNADQGSDVLRKASISGVSKEECNICKGKKKQKYCPITDTQLCVQGYKSVDVCKGDSGGPLMVFRLNIYQIGITSFKGSEYCGAENMPSIFTKVESYLPWILDNIRE